MKHSVPTTIALFSVKLYERPSPFILSWLLTFAGIPGYSTKGSPNLRLHSCNKRCCINDVPVLWIQLPLYNFSYTIPHVLQYIKIIIISKKKKIPENNTLFTDTVTQHQNLLFQTDVFAIMVLQKTYQARINTFWSWYKVVSSIQWKASLCKLTEVTKSKINTGWSYSSIQWK